MPADKPPIALVNVPWARVDAPSIQCGLLQAELAAAGHAADVHYLNMELAAHIGRARYDSIMAIPGGGRAWLLGEWLFGVVAFGERDDEEEYLKLFTGSALFTGLGVTAEELARMRNQVLPSWADQVTGDGRWEQYQIVGFTSTFEQNVAALGLARLIKQRYPHITTIFGGANFDGEMGAEYVRALPWIDYAVIGEGDRAFPEFVTRMMNGRDPAGIPGLCHRVAGTVTGTSQAPLIADLDALPAPDYTSYFSTLARLGRAEVLAGDTPPRLPYESSRGCWWGERHHCTFCGLNGLGMRYRSKSPARVIADLRDLTARHQVLGIDTVDNILDMSYLTSLCTALRDQPWDMQIFYEVKANLRRDQLHVLKQAGITSIQPGIESLSTHILDLMRKGSSLLINLRIMKWAHYYGITVGWNILMGLPGETDEDYQAQIDLIPSLHHLRPPAGCGPISLDRFSPYYADPAAPKFPGVQPGRAYQYVYPAEVDPWRIAYFFDYSLDHADVASRPARRKLISTVEDWRQHWASGPPPVLRYERGPDWLKLTDTRDGRNREGIITGWRASAYEYCGETPRSRTAIRDHLSTTTPGITDHALQHFLDTCRDQRLMATDKNHYFSLAIPASLPPQPTENR